MQTLLLFSCVVASGALKASRLSKSKTHNVVSPYYKGVDGTNDCAGGQHIVDEATCKSAGNYLGLTWFGSYDPDQHLPTGCYIGTGGEANYNGGGLKVGSAGAGRIPICMPCDTPSGTCTVVEDPHIGVFDGSQISLRAVQGHKKDRTTSGDKWLVKSGSVKIQARYMSDERLKEKNEFVRFMAVGGAFLKGNIIIVGSLDDDITWNGNPILSRDVAGSPHFEFQERGLSVNITRSDHSQNVANLSQVNPGIEMQLPMGVSLIVNRLRHHLNVAITMPPQEGGQEGLCGNFNGVPSDDSLELSSQRLDHNVPREDSMFAGLTSA